MKKKIKNKKGFTLLELMLSIAIITIISGLFIGLIIATNKSYITVCEQNDLADCAALQSKGYEQLFLDNALYGDVKKSFSFTIQNNKLYCNNNIIFAPPITKIQNYKDKWQIRMGFNYNSTTNFIKYKIQIQDNNQKLYYTTENGFTMPHYNRNITTIGSEIEPGYYSYITIKQQT